MILMVMKPRVRDTTRLGPLRFGTEFETDFNSAHDNNSPLMQVVDRTRNCLLCKPIFY